MNIVKRQVRYQPISYKVPVPSSLSRGYVLTVGRSHQTRTLLMIVFQQSFIRSFHHNSPLYMTYSRICHHSTFISWVKLFYASPSARVLTNNQYSKPFSLHRGTRQGCLLSPLLFMLAVEPLAIALRDCKQISGVWRGGLEHKVSLYADDLLL